MEDQKSAQPLDYESATRTPVKPFAIVLVLVVWTPVVFVVSALFAVFFSGLLVSLSPDVMKRPAAILLGLICLCLAVLSVRESITRFRQMSSQTEAPTLGRYQFVGTLIGCGVSALAVAVYCIAVFCFID